jgi:hypothetical protein
VLKIKIWKRLKLCQLKLSFKGLTAKKHIKIYQAIRYDIFELQSDISGTLYSINNRVKPNATHPAYSNVLPAHMRAMIGEQVVYSSLRGMLFS